MLFYITFGNEGLPWSIITICVTIFMNANIIWSLMLSFYDVNASSMKNAFKIDYKHLVIIFMVLTLCILVYKLAGWVINTFFSGFNNTGEIFDLFQRSFSKEKKVTVGKLCNFIQKLPSEIYISDNHEPLNMEEFSENLRKKRIHRIESMNGEELLRNLVRIKRNNNNKYNKNSCTDTSCSICLADYKIGEYLTKLPCEHRYHKHCIEKWVFSHLETGIEPSCPYCKKVFTLKA